MNIWERLKLSYQIATGKINLNNLAPYYLASYYLGLWIGGMSVALDKDPKRREKLTELAKQFVDSLREAEKGQK